MKRQSRWTVVAVTILVVVTGLGRLDLDGRDDLVGAALFIALCGLVVGGSLLRDRCRSRAQGPVRDTPREDPFGEWPSRR
ncbi:MAG: hypothetical protein P1U38_11675 [Aeromicrobium sp.]|uniref:hypothetical protein n=1 Tax=Aeromicrobium sp. TaxID=1871063 RepID=UPI002624549C|nr:hypothetical protein [Aeromicrobium sp.]MDF1705424.1 hypothetical protein [Aeromicrobium sp.]